MKIQNYDIEDDENNDFVQLHDFMPDKSFRMLICAPSGSGKTKPLLTKYTFTRGISNKVNISTY